MTPWITGEGGVAYDPTLSVLEAIRDLSAGRSDLLRRSLVQQAVSQKLLNGTAAALKAGLVAVDHDANLLLVDGDPTRDIAATERISMVVLKGERVRRVDLFDAAKHPLQ